MNYRSIDRRNRMSDLTKEQLEEHIKYIEAVPDIPTNVREKKFFAKCPCGGTITAWRVKYNGHIRAMCDKCGFRLMA